MIDVIIPVKSTNNKFILNISHLASYDWVSSILIGDSGLLKGQYEELTKLEKITICDQKHIKSQGMCIQDLARKTKTEYIAYFHGDVTVPEDWFDVMISEIKDSAILECHRIYEYDVKYSEPEDFTQLHKRRPLSGTQLIQKSKFLTSTNHLQDDYLFRNEDLVFASLIKQAGFEYSITDKTHHRHQIDFTRENENVSYNKRVNIISTPSKDDLHMFENQIFGLIKYASAKDSHCCANFDLALSVYLEFGGNIKKVRSFARQYPEWTWFIRLYQGRMAARKIRAALKVMRRSNFNYFFVK